MLELNWYQNNVPKGERLWYVHPVVKQMLDIHAMSQHMEQHNTPFSAGTIEGILTDFVKCIHEQLLNGNSVKIDDLAIFSISLSSEGYKELGGIDLNTGQFEAQARLDSAVKSTKLLARATGQFVRETLNRNVRFDWCTEAKAMMEAKRQEVLNGQGKGKDDNLQTPDTGAPASSAEAPASPAPATPDAKP